MPYCLLVLNKSLSYISHGHKRTSHGGGGGGSPPRKKFSGKTAQIYVKKKNFLQIFRANGVSAPPSRNLLLGKEGPKFGQNGWPFFGDVFFFRKEKFFLVMFCFF